jgi:hypothetical protein
MVQRRWRVCVVMIAGVGAGAVGCGGDDGPEIFPDAGGEQTPDGAHGADSAVDSTLAVDAYAPADASEATDASDASTAFDAFDAADTSDAPDAWDATDAADAPPDTWTFDAFLPPDPSCAQCGQLAWVRQGGGDAGTGNGQSVTILTDESAVVVGSYGGQAAFGEGDAETALAPFGGGDIVVARYSPAGDLLWAKRAGGTGLDFAFDTAPTRNGGAHVVGTFSSSATFGPGESGETVLTSAGSYDAFLARYAADGSLVWAKGVGGSSIDYGYGAASLPDDGLAVVGSFWSNPLVLGDADAGQRSLAKQAGVQEAAFFARYTSAGALVWAKSAQGTTTTTPYSVAAAVDGSLTAAGVFWGSGTTVFGAGEANPTSFSTPGTDTFVVRYNGDGTLRWARRSTTGANSYAVGQHVAVVSDGSALVTGYCAGAVIFGAGEPGQTTVDPCTIFVARFAADGSLLWAQSVTHVVDGGNDTYGRGIAATAGGGALVAGEFGGTQTFGFGSANATTMTSTGRSAAFTARYYADGGFAWAKQAGGPSTSGPSFTTTNSGYGIAVANDGSSYFVGNFYPPATFGSGEPGATTLEAGAGYQLFIAKLLP